MSEKESPTTSLPTEVPPTTGEFDVEVVGELTRKKFVGTFSCRILNRKLRAQVDKHRAFLNGDNPQGMSLDILQLHHRISYLRFALTDPYPKFWSENDLGYGLFDGNVIDVVFERVLAFEESWMRIVWGDAAVEKMKK